MSMFSLAYSCCSSRLCGANVLLSVAVVLLMLLLLSKINTIYYLLYTTDHQLLANVAQTNLVNNTSNWPDENILKMVPLYE
jgi:hypothetical protein